MWGTVDQIMWNVFDKFTPKNGHVVDSSQNLIKNLDRDKNWSMWICKEHKIIPLKVMDEKNHFTKCKGHFERFSLQTI